MKNLQCLNNMLNQVKLTFLHSAVCKVSFYRELQSSVKSIYVYGSTNQKLSIAVRFLYIRRLVFFNY